MDIFQITDTNDALEALEAFYASVDEAVSRLLAAHPHRLSCRLGCIDCCIDGITVFAVEAENIRRRYEQMRMSRENTAQAGCVFLDAFGACRIYPHRPYVCRTQGLPLRWLEDMADGSTVEMRDICPKNDGQPALETLSEHACWTIGPHEAKLAHLQKAFGRGRLNRVSLSDVFRRVPH